MMSRTANRGQAMAASLAQEIAWIVTEAEVDYIDLWHLMLAANEATDADPKLSRMDRTLALVGRLLDRGFLAVDLAEAGQCIPWPDQRRAAILGRIEREWRRLEDEPLLGSIFWFQLPAERR